MQSLHFCLHIRRQTSQYTLLVNFNFNSFGAPSISYVKQSVSPFLQVSSTLSVLNTFNPSSATALSGMLWWSVVSDLCKVVGTTVSDFCWLASMRPILSTSFPFPNWTLGEVQSSSWANDSYPHQRWSGWVVRRCCGQWSLQISPVLTANPTLPFPYW